MKRKMLSLAQLISKKKMNELEERIGFSSAIFMVIGIPVRTPHGNPYTWTKKTTHYEMTLQRHPEFKLPSGSYARLIQIWIDTEVKIKKTDVLDFGNSLNAFLKHLGIKEGKANREVLKQLLNYLTTRVIVRYLTDNDKNHRTELDSVISVARDLYFDTKNMNQLDLWHSKVKLSPALANYIQNHAVPIDLNLVAHFKNNPLALDLLRFIVYRNNALQGRRKGISFDDKELYDHLGCETKNIRVTRERVKKIIGEIQHYWPELKAGIKDNKQKHIFYLKSSKPLIAKKILS